MEVLVVEADELRTSGFVGGRGCRADVPPAGALLAVPASEAMFGFGYDLLPGVHGTVACRITGIWS
jgi:hypothetical protein